jgi:hypothetical protein
MERALAESRQELRRLSDQIAEMRREFVQVMSDQVAKAVSSGIDVAMSRLRRDPDQTWFWSPEWKKGEGEATADVAAGRVTRFSSDNEFLDSLRR